MSAPVGILLAAGTARRFGAHKLLHPLPDGVPVGIAAARVLVRELPRVIAVIRPGDEDLAAAFAALDLQVVENPDADAGMGSSLAAGVRASADASGWLVALADMPWVQGDTVAALAARLRQGAELVAPWHAGRRGHPVGFAAAWGPALLAMRGDQGARSVLAAHAQRLELLEVDDPGVLADVDRRADLVRSAVLSRNFTKS